MRITFRIRTDFFSIDWKKFGVQFKIFEENRHVLAW